MGWIGREKRYSIKDFRDGEILFLRAVLLEHPDEESAAVLDRLEKQRLSKTDIAYLIRQIKQVRPVDARGTPDDPNEHKNLLNMITRCNLLIKKAGRAVLVNITGKEERIWGFFGK